MEHPSITKQSSGTILKMVTTVPVKLYIAGIAKSQVPIFMHPLIKALFFSTNKDRWFISMTETPDEISLLLSEDGINSFPPDSILLAKENPWIAISFSMGNPTTPSQGFIADVAGALARDKISIFYVTTFNSDYILVEESKYNAARACIENHFPIDWVEEDELVLAPQQSSVAEQQEQGVTALESFKRLQAFPELPLVLTRISRSKLEGCVTDLIKLIFYPTNTFRYLSFTRTEEEVSLIVDENTLKEFPGEKLQVVLDPSWIPIMRTQKKGFTETGVVSAIAAPIKNMNMLYLSSFKTGWLMVTREGYEEAVERLHKAGFEVSTKKQEKQKRKSGELDRELGKLHLEIYREQASSL